MDKIGRPRKYNSKLQAIGFCCPEEYAEYFKDQAHELRMSVNEYLNSLVMSADKELAAKLAVELRELREAIKEKSKAVQEINGELDDFKRHSKLATDFVLGNIEEIPELKEAVDSAVENAKPQFSALVKSGRPDEAYSLSVKKSFAEVETELLNKGRTIRKPSLVKALIKKRLAETAR